MQKVKRIILLALITIFVFILQLYLFNEVSFFGVKANLILVLVVAFSIWIKPNITIPFVFVIGILSDLIFTYSLGRGLITYLIIMLIIMVTSRMYNMQNIGVIIIVMAISTFLFETIFWVFDGIHNSNLQSILNLLEIVFKGAIINSILQALSIKIFSKFKEE